MPVTLFMQRMEAIRQLRQGPPGQIEGKTLALVTQVALDFGSGLDVGMGQE